MQSNIATYSLYGSALTSLRYRIMLAEDDIEFRHLLARVLESDGYQVLRINASSSTTKIKLFETGSIAARIVAWLSLVCNVRATAWVIHSPGR